jgi:hypothetical protein
MYHHIVDKIAPMNRCYIYRRSFELRVAMGPQRQDLEGDIQMKNELLGVWCL